MKHPIKTHTAKDGVEDAGFGYAGLGRTMGGATGEADGAVEAGGWAGTDDATSTAPSDQMGNPAMSEAEKPIDAILHDFDESVRLDGEQQEEAAENVDEAAELSELAERRQGVDAKL